MGVLKEKNILVFAKNVTFLLQFFSSILHLDIVFGGKNKFDKNVTFLLGQEKVEIKILFQNCQKS